MARPGRPLTGRRSFVRSGVIDSLDRRFWLAAICGTAAAGAILGIPTAVIPNPWFVRMLPTDPVNVVVLLASAPLLGGLFATYAAPRDRSDPHGSGGAAVPSAASVASYLAIGCPICNKLIVAAIGVTGATTVFAPLQPVIGAASIVTLVLALWLRLRRRASDCPSCQRLPAPVDRAIESGPAPYRST